MGILNGKKILVGITAGIAAYKVYELIRMYRKNGAEVKVILTPNSEHFVSILTLQTLSKSPVYREQFMTENLNPEHIDLGSWADVCVIAPLTANTLGKIANGICDNLLTSVLCAFKKPVVLAPSMNTGMWDNPFVQENIKKLSSAGHHTIEPEEGYLACETEGKGRLPLIEHIFDKTVEVLGA